MDKELNKSLFKNCFGDLPKEQQEIIFNKLSEIIDKTQYTPYIGNKD